MAERRVSRLWFPAAVIVLAGLCGGALYAWPNLERGQRAGSTVFFLVPGTVLLLTIWLVFLSGMRWAARLCILVGVVALVAGTVRNVEFEGDMVPIVHYRWEGLNDLTL